MPSLARIGALAAVPLFALTFAACSGSVNTATGGSNSGGGGTGTGGGAGSCPAAEPGFGAPCATIGQSCSYGNPCCPDIYQCETSGWVALPTGCAAPPEMCPADAPAAGSGCDVCSTPSACTYACPGSAAQISASCNGGTWALTGECPTPPPVTCGSTTCKPGEVCVQSQGGAGFSFTCAADPCAPGPLSCTCAQGLCGGAPFQCQSAMDQTVMCACPTCP